MILGKITRLEDRYGSMRRYLFRFIEANHGAEVLRQVRAEMPRLAMINNPLYARVDAGRWIVDCPVCPNAQFASQQDSRFFCVACLRGWYPVVWPAQTVASRIEATLMLRPNPATRNWRPHEDLAQLVAENVGHGVGGEV